MHYIAVGDIMETLRHADQHITVLCSQSVMSDLVETAACCADSSAPFPWRHCPTLARDLPIFSNYHRLFWAFQINRYKRCPWA